jgi:TonB family protein
MKRDVVYSLILHVLAITLLVVSSPFVKSKTFDYEVIRVNAVSPAQLPSSVSQQMTTPEPVTIPQAMADEPVELPMDKPSSIKKTVKTNPKPKPKKTPRKEPVKNANTATTQTNKTTEGEGENKQIDVKATGNGASFGGATIDNASFNYPYWFQQAFNKIASNWHRTVLIDAPVVCVVSFQVIKSGRVYNVKVEKSSGIPAVDETCVQAIQSSAPFPPLPDEFRDEIIGITIPFKYQPR